MDFRSLGLFYNFECFLIFSLRNQQGAVCVMRGRPSQGAPAVLKGAPLAPLRFLHAHSCLVLGQGVALARSGSDPRNAYGEHDAPRACPHNPDKVSHGAGRGVVRPGVAQDRKR